MLQQLLFGLPTEVNHKVRAPRHLNAGKMHEDVIHSILFIIIPLP